MDGDKSLSATYSLNTYTLTVNATNGTVTKLPDQTTYDHGTVVQLTAHLPPATTSSTGRATRPGPTLTTSVTMDGDKTVTANFAINTYTLTYTAGTGGSITGSLRKRSTTAARARWSRRSLPSATTSSTGRTAS